MIRSIAGFAIFAVVALLSLKLIGALLGGFLGLILKILWLAFIGWLIYLVLKMFAPNTAAKVKETVTGNSD